MKVMKKDSNIYTIIYATVLVILVGVGLSVIYQALHPMQQKNIADDTKRQILAAALITPGEGETISEVYDKYIIDSFIVNEGGEKVDSKIDAFDVDVKQEVKKPGSQRLLPVFVCKTDGGNKYILPVYGAGLWGPIWGYIAFDGNGDTIYGAYFAHEGETPGLGAEIEKPAFSSQFEGKDVFNSDGTFEGIKVVKTGHEPSTGSYVHAISGGTITSQGVQRMLSESLLPYSNYLKNLNQSSDKSNNTPQIISKDEK